MTIYILHDLDQVVIGLKNGLMYALHIDSIRSNQSESIDLRHFSRFPPVTIPGNMYQIPISDSGKVAIYDAATRSVLLEIDHTNDFPGHIVNQTISSNGKHMAAIHYPDYDRSLKNKVVLWSLPPIIARRAHQQALADFMQLNTASIEEGEVIRRFWDLESDRWVFDRAVSEIHRCLSPKERKKLHFSLEPPCWCQNKSYPLSAHWQKALGYNPYTEKRTDGQICFEGRSR